MTITMITSKRTSPRHERSYGYRVRFNQKDMAYPTATEERRATDTTEYVAAERMCICISIYVRIFFRGAFDGALFCFLLGGVCLYWLCFGAFVMLHFVVHYLIYVFGATFGGAFFDRAMFGSAICFCFFFLCIFVCIIAACSFQKCFV